MAHAKHGGIPVPGLADQLLTEGLLADDPYGADGTLERRFACNPVWL
jgi:hypothetical protein